MEAMLKKLNESSQGEPDQQKTFDGLQGERKLKEITSELTDYYHQNKKRQKSPTNRNDTEYSNTIEECDHVQRNTMLMAKYREMSHIKS